jgi:NADH dehydrogenase [ubiquinone] 1 alpha subcomplex assembly factor 1
MKKSVILLGVVLVLLILGLVGQSILKEETAVSSTAQEVVVAEAPVEPSAETEVSDEPIAEAVVPVVATARCEVLDDFTGTSDLRWYTVNDGVMGGLSDGFATIENNRLIHSGEIVTRGGGFSYVGTRLPNDALVGYSSLQVRLNTGGRAYATNFADSRSWRVTHQVSVPETANIGWQEVTINFKDTVPTIFSRRVNSNPFDPRAVEELAFILSDGVDGVFRTEIDWIKICR